MQRIGEQHTQLQHSPIIPPCLASVPANRALGVSLHENDNDDDDGLKAVSSSLIPHPSSLRTRNTADREDDENGD